MNEVEIYPVLRRLFLLYATYWMEQDFSDFIAAKVVSIEHRSSLMSAIRHLLKVMKIVPTIKNNSSKKYNDLCYRKYDQMRLP